MGRGGRNAHGEARRPPASAPARRPRAGARPGVPRQYEQFAALYRQYRVKGGKDHKEAMDLILKEKGR